MAGIEIQLLGRLALVRDGDAVCLGSPLQRTLFATLATHPGTVFGRDRLIESIWGDARPTTAANSLYTYVARLRRAFDAADAHPSSRPVLITHGSGYALHVSAETIDLCRFEEHLRRARELRRSQSFEAALDELDRALALWAGAPFPGAVGPYIEQERDRLEAHRLAVTEERAELLVATGQVATAARLLDELSINYPLHERLRYMLMFCYATLGRRADAIAEYHRLRVTLQEELGVEPDLRINRLLQRILRGESYDLPLYTQYPDGIA